MVKEELDSSCCLAPPGSLVSATVCSSVLFALCFHFIVPHQRYQQELGSAAPQRSESHCGVPPPRFQVLAIQPPLSDPLALEVVAVSCFFVISVFPFHFLSSLTPLKTSPYTKFSVKMTYFCFSD